MNINATLLGQMITFMLFAWFTMRFVWPPVTAALAKRQEAIADGLAAAERGHHDLSLAQDKAKDILRSTRLNCEEILSEARSRADNMIDEAKRQAKEEAGRILARSEEEVSQMASDARETLRADVSALVISGAEKIISRHIDAQANADLLEKLIEEL